MAYNPVNYSGTPGSGPSLDTYQFGSLADRWKPQMADIVYNKYGDEFFSAYSLISTFSERKAVYGPIILHKERDWFSAPMVTAGGTGAGAPGASVTITLAASSLDANNLFFAQAGNTGVLKNYDSYIITATAGVGTSSPTVTLKPVSGGTIPAFASGEEISVIGFASSEGAGQPTAYEQQDFEYQYPLQFFKHTEAITGTAQEAEPWATKDDQGVNQKGKQRLKIRGERQMITKFSNSMMVQDADANSLTGDPLNYTMQGWLPFIMNNGGVSSQLAAGAFSLSLLNGISDEFDTVNAGGQYVFVSGNTRQREIVNAATSTYSSNAMVYVTDGSDFKSRWLDSMDTESAKRIGKEININVVSYTDGTRKFHFSNLKSLSDPSTVNPAGYSNNLLTFMLPMNTTERTKGSGPAPFIEACFMPGAKQHGFLDFWEGGANSEYGTTDKDNDYMYWKGHWGQRLVKPENWGCFYA